MRRVMTRVDTRAPAHDHVRYMGVKAHPVMAAEAITARLAHERGRAAVAKGRASSAAKRAQALAVDLQLVHGRRVSLIETVHQTIDESRHARARARHLRLMADRAQLVASEQYLRLMRHRSATGQGE